MVQDARYPGATAADVSTELGAALLSLREVEVDLRGAAMIAAQCPECGKSAAAIEKSLAALDIPRAVIKQAILDCLKADRPLILIVDDVPSIQTLLQQCLENEGYTVLVAHDGRFAIEFVRLLTPALVLLDLMMPEMDGPAFLQAMDQQTNMDIPPVVVLTALQREVAAAHLAQVGRHDLPILTKPFHLPDLLSVVAEQASITTRRSGAEPPRPASKVRAPRT